MSIQNNFPAIKPTLLLDFANTEQLDPRITFTRASTATFYDGRTVAKAEENLLLQSQTFDSATWVKTGVTVTANGAVAPDGTTTAESCSYSTAGDQLRQFATFSSGLPYAISIYARSVSGNTTLSFDLTNAETQTFTVTGTWARYEWTVTPSAARTWLDIQMAGTAVVELWGAQVEQRSAVTAYTPTTTQPITNYIPVLLTAAAGVPRFEHNPITGESLGLEIEEQRTNLVTYSEQFDDASWTKGGGSITANAITSPDGNLTADRLVEDTSTGEHRVSRGIALGGSVDGSAYAISVFAKASGRTRIRMIDNNQIASGLSVFDLAAGTVVSGTGQITPVGNGWYRCTIFPLKNFSTTSILIINLVSSGTTFSYTGDGFSGVFLWGAQLEAGAFATSYIPTVASQVTRSADAASMTGTNFSSWYRADEGTLYAEAITTRPTGGVAVATAYAGSQQGLELVVLNTMAQFGVVVNAAYTANISLGDVSSGTPFKMVGAYKVNDFAGSRNGAAAATDTAGNVPSASPPTTLFLGGYAGAPTASWALSGTIKKIAYYPLRVTNAQLSALTS